MKNLKYIKLFEAFDARTLNVTLKHIKGKDDKKNFLGQLKTICDKFDIPESKLSDDLFTYLPSALNQNLSKDKSDLLGLIPVPLQLPQ